MKFILAISALALVAAFTAPAWGHGGGLDRYGCHNNRRTGGYHCHRAPAPAADTPRTLYSRTPSATQSRDTVIAAQTLLNHLGCDAGTPDGSVGALARAAVDRFARVTGHEGSAVDAALARRLAEAVAAGERC
jgi:hypothetical protein